MLIALDGTLYWHFVYRPMMDDAVAATLNSVTYFNNAFIVAALHRDNDYVRRVFLRLEDATLPQVYT